MEQQPDQMVTKDFISGIDKKECQLCHSTGPTHWRKGPEGPKGPKILCNACGLRYHDQRKKINKQNSFKKKINTNLTLGPTPNRK